MISFLARYWFLFGLALAMACGFLLSASIETVSGWSWLRRGIVMGVMFLMALPLPIQAIAETIRRPWAAILASIINFVLLPFVAWNLSAWVDPVYVGGFLVIAATPCTLASAAVWTGRASGNEVTALMTTVLTNSLSFLVSPLIILVLIQQSAKIEFGEMVYRLFLLVLLPIAAAQVVAVRERVGTWARKNKRQLGILAQIGILMMVFLGTARSTLDLAPDRPSTLLGTLQIVVICGVLHLLVLAGGYWLARWLRFSRRDQIAVAISGSQKTLMIGLLICLMLKVSLLPMIVYHATQLILDTFIADWFASQNGRRN